MFGLGFSEIIIVLVVALLVLGPEKLPKLAKQLGRGMREFKRAASEFQSTLSDADPTRTQKRPKTPTKPPAGTLDAAQSLSEEPSATAEKDAEAPSTAATAAKPEPEN